jgi:UDP-4-amino-4,6-dideoxy-N-acetyl-beta-L-altrosamine N-acetyltransferase
MLNNIFSLSNISFRPLERNDLAMVLEWRNSENIRKFMLSNELISLNEHIQWFDKTSKDSSHENLIAEYNGAPFGFISITDIKPIDGTCTWGMYIGEKKVGLGLGVLLEICTIDRMFNFHKVRKIWGQVLSSNRIKFLHYKLGFVDEGILKQHIYRNNLYEDLIFLSLFSDQWNNKRSKILESIGILDN